MFLSKGTILFKQVDVRLIIRCCVSERLECRCATDQESSATSGDLGSRSCSATGIGAIANIPVNGGITGSQRHRLDMFPALHMN